MRKEFLTISSATPWPHTKCIFGIFCWHLKVFRPFDVGYNAAKRTYLSFVVMAASAAWGENVESTLHRRRRSILFKVFYSFQGCSHCCSYSLLARCGLSAPSAAFCYLMRSVKCQYFNWILLSSVPQR